MRKKREKNKSSIVLRITKKLKRQNRKEKKWSPKNFDLKSKK